MEEYGNIINYEVSNNNIYLLTCSKPSKYLLESNNIYILAFIDNEITVLLNQKGTSCFDVVLISSDRDTLAYSNKGKIFVMQYTNKEVCLL